MKTRKLFLLVEPLEIHLDVCPQRASFVFWLFLDFYSSAIQKKSINAIFKTKFRLKEEVMIKLIKNFF